MQPLTPPLDSSHFVQISELPALSPAVVKEAAVCLRQVAMKQPPPKQAVVAFAQFVVAVDCWEILDMKIVVAALGTAVAIFVVAFVVDKYFEYASLVVVAASAVSGNVVVEEVGIFVVVVTLLGGEDVVVVFGGAK